MQSRSLSDDSDTAGENAHPTPDYAFDGYDVVFSMKVALIPPTPAKPTARNQRRDPR
jgi:hypothetical protein